MRGPEEGRETTKASGSQARATKASGSHARGAQVLVCLGSKRGDKSRARDLPCGAQEILVCLINFGGVPVSKPPVPVDYTAWAAVAAYLYRAATPKSASLTSPGLCLN